jgi:hypothetical protein
MKTPDKNNDNGMVVEDQMTYDDLLRQLNDDREWSINALTESRIQMMLKEDDVMSVLVNLHKFNNIEYDSEYYLRDDVELREELFKDICGWYQSMTNEEIVEWYRKNEPYVFDMQNQLEKIFAL